MISALSFGFETPATITAAELEACLWGVSYFAAWLRGPQEAAENISCWRVLDTAKFAILEIADLVQ
eukprot:12398745-Karenia_brevis.AAC.1